ncbi:MAG: flagellar protein [Campylobacterota bacterium]|nr:flagellar protein [Campylobacterota bacterium]
MFKLILSLLFSFNLYALEISLASAKENFEKYSTLHIKEDERFSCNEIKDDFEVTTKIICAFKKQPSTKFKQLQNDFFQVNTVNKKNTFFIVIKPIKKIKLYPMIFNFTKDDTIFNASVKSSSHWMVVGYKEKLPYIKNDKEPEIGINFPFHLKKKNLPFVGGLDIKGNPVYIKEVQDVSDYLEIKKLYSAAKYEKCLTLINEIRAKYPNSLFNSEFIFYKIRVYAKMENFDEIIELAKIYIREYSSDENIPEVLSLMAKSYSKIGLNVDADYFFDRVFDEHQDSVYAKWSYIYKGEMLEDSGNTDKALSFYKRALHESNDVEVASTAAYRLAQYNLRSGYPKEASNFTMKIVNAKPDFFMNEYEASKEMMYSFEEEDKFFTAASISNALLNKIDKKHDDHERLLYDKAIWLSKTDKKQESLDTINSYLSTYQYGFYEDELQVAKDALFFDTTDSNISTKLTQYNELIETYMNDTIGDRAIYEKAKLLLENNMYSDLLGFKDSILALDNEKYNDTDEIVKTAAIGIMKESLKRKECENVIKTSAEYNITLSNEWDDGIYECSMMGGDYKLSKKVASRNLKSKDLELRKKWLYRYIKVDFETGNYSDVIEASKELVLLIENDKNSQYKNVYRYIFDTYQRLENKDNMVKSILDIEERFGLTYEDIDRFVSMIAVARDKRDDNMLIKFASQVVKMQQKSSSYAQSPYVEFTLYQAYINNERFEDALKIIKSLDKIDLTNKKRARQKYLLGNIYTKLWREDEAQIAYQESIDADETSSWAKLAKDAKGI